MQEQVLFDTAQYVKRPRSNQKEFEELILPYIPKFEQAYAQSAFELRELHQNHPPHHFLSRFDAMFFNGKFIGILKDIIGWEHFGVNPEGRDFLKVGKYTVFFKKVDANMEPRNLRTGSTDRIDLQYARSTEELSPIIFIGYKPMAGNWSIASGIYAIYRDKEQSQHWVSDLLAIKQIHNIDEKVSIENVLMPTIDSEKPRVKVRQKSSQAI